jgi:hypothetical protein
MKKLIILTVVVFALALLVAPAAEATVTIKRTGAGSTNEVIEGSSKSIVVSGTIMGGVRNRTLAIGNTGLNFSLGNTVGGEIKTDNVSNTTSNTSGLNNNTISVNQGANPCCDPDAEINTTGAGSINKITMTNSKSVSVTGSITGGVSNGTLAIGNTGVNLSLGNTVGGGIDTGSVTLKDTNYTEVNTLKISITQ